MVEPEVLATKKEKLLSPSQMMSDAGFEVGETMTCACTDWNRQTKAMLKMAFAVCCFLNEKNNPFNPSSFN